MHDIKLKLCEYEKISIETLTSYIQYFEKYIKSSIKKYKDNSGLEDYKMHKEDYKILLELYENTHQCKMKLHILLLYIYSYYKLDAFDYDHTFFPFKKFFSFLNKNENIHTLILSQLKSFS